MSALSSSPPPSSPSPVRRAPRSILISLFFIGMISGVLTTFLLRHVHVTFDTDFHDKIVSLMDMPQLVRGAGSLAADRRPAPAIRTAKTSTDATALKPKPNRVHKGLQSVAENPVSEKAVNHLKASKNEMNPVEKLTQLKVPAPQTAEKPKEKPKPKAPKVEKIKEVTIPMADKEIVEFEHVEGGVIVSKIQGTDNFRHVQQMICLLHYAYNDRVNYPIVIFTANPMPEHEIAYIENMIAPTKISFVQDNPGLPNLLGNMTEAHKQNLIKRCNVSGINDLHWKSKCVDIPDVGQKGTDPLSYNWQAEFRTLHVWKHPALAPYRYMLWLDADGFCTHKWDRDPIAMMAKNKLALLFDKFPGGGSGGKDFDEKYRRAFGRDLCGIDMKNGHFVPALKEKCRQSPKVKQIYGFFHVTDLDFYRSEEVYGWQQILIGNETRLRRRFDDQIAVTVPAAVYAGNRSWEMEYHGFKAGVFHNHYLDGKYFIPGRGFIEFWGINGSTSFPEAYGKCNITAWG